ncbi:MAG TPA: ABC transporter permease [Candidatus Acidoferrum sp.]|nr:ABC transporter permease [Candidatus Acidoferrum sp.]
MRTSIVYNVFMRDFRKQKKRITLTLIALAWGTISIMLLLGFGEGLHRQLTVNQKGIGDCIAVLWGGQTTIPYKGMGKGRPIRLHPEDVEFLRTRVSDLAEVGGEYSRWGLKLKYQNTYLNEHVTGIMPNYELMRNFIPQMGGRMINADDMEFKRRVIFIGSSLKNRLFKEEEAIGKQVIINSIPFTVVGVMIPKMQMSSYEGMDEDQCAMPATTFQAIFGDPYLDDIIYMPKIAKEMKSVETQVRTALASKYKFDPKDDRAVQVWDVAESLREMSKVLIGLKIFLGIIGGLTLLIAGVGVANIMYVSIKERTREIGIKMAVGARKVHILLQFLMEALIITFSGGVLGMVVSYFMIEGFKGIPIKSDVLDFMGRPTLSMGIGITVIVILGLMGLASGLFPAMKAASVNPVDSLRYE